MKNKYYERFLRARCPVCGKHVVNDDMDSHDFFSGIHPCKHLVFAYDEHGEYLFKRKEMEAILNIESDSEAYFKTLCKEFNFSLQRHQGPYNPSSTSQTFFGFKRK